jgi:hypothetical protein
MIDMLKLSTILKIKNLSDFSYNFMKVAKNVLRLSTAQHYLLHQ